MATYITRRLLLMIPTLLGITFLVFMLVALAPGGIGAVLNVSGGAMQSSSGVAVMQAYLEDRYGLDDPVLVQYGRWLGRISPIKFGPRDQIAPSGERIRPPKPVKDPPLWEWFSTGLPPAPPAKPASGDPPTDAVEAYRDAERDYAQTRGDYVAAVTVLRQALADYAREAGMSHAVDRDGKPREHLLAATEPDRTLSTWPRAQQLAQETIAAYADALRTRAALAEAFAAKPYPEAGIPVIPGTLSLAPPDFGTAFSRGRPVLDLILTALPVTLLLNFLAFPIIYLVAIPSGMLAATHRGSWLDVGLGALYIAFWSFPVVLAGVLAIGFLASSDYLGLFPVSGLHANAAATFRYLPSRSADGAFQPGYLLDLLWHICLPVLCLVYGGFAILSKQTRAAMLDNFNADYVRTAKAKGVSPKNVVLRHVFRNSLLPLITLFVTIFPLMLSGSVVIERIFTVPGMGSLLIDAIGLRDRELILANATMIASVNLLALLAADILYALADPRIAYD